MRILNCALPAAFTPPITGQSLVPGGAGVNYSSRYRASIMALTAKIDKVMFDDKKDPTPVYTRVTKKEKITEESYSENGIGGVGIYQVKAEGADYIRNQYAEGILTVAVPVEKVQGFTVSQIVFEKIIKSGILTKEVLHSASELRRAGIASIEKDAADYYINGDDTNSPSGVNGTQLFDAAQPCLNSSTATYSNLITTELSMQALNQMFQLSSLMLGEDGLPIDMNHKLLVVPPQLEAAALELKKSLYTPESSTNRANIFAGRIEVLKWNWLKDAPTEFYLIDTSRLDLAVKEIERVGLQLQEPTQDPDSRDLNFDARYRNVFQHFFSQGAIKSTGATAAKPYGVIVP
jgi:hypothetical protein